MGYKLNDTKPKEATWIKVSDLREGNFFQLRGGVLFYKFSALVGDAPLSKGIVFYQNDKGKDRERKMFPFTLVKYFPNKTEF